MVSIVELVMLGQLRSHFVVEHVIRFGLASGLDPVRGERHDDLAVSRLIGPSGWHVVLGSKQTRPDVGRADSQVSASAQRRVRPF